MPCGCTPDSSYGEQIGARLGAFGGAALQSLATAKFARFFGSGDYEVNYNSLFPGGGHSKVDGRTTIMSGSSHATRIRYREYLGDVTLGTAGAFNAQTFRLQPGNNRTFPWFSTIAQQYEEYIFNGIVFEFKSTASDLSTTANMGSVMMATNYDPSDPVFANKQEMLMSAYSQEFKLDDNGFHGVECAYFETPNAIKFVRTSFNDPPDVDDYDLGNFTIATQGSSGVGGTVVGSLYIYYDITLLKERLWGSLGRAFLNLGVQIGPSATAFTNALPLDWSQARTQTLGNLPFAQICATNNVITFPTWTPNAVWLIIIQWQGSVQQAFTPPTITALGCAGIPALWPTLGHLHGPATGETTARALQTLFIQQQGQVATITLGAAGSLPTGTRNFVFSLQQVDNLAGTLQTQ